jgi:segregation and condensation protein B
MEPSELKPVLEALLFSAESPLTLEQLAEATESDPAPIAEALTALAAEWAEPGRGLRLAEMAGGWIVLTREEYAPFVGRLLRGKKKMRLSRPALETLAIIAYKQPVTKIEVDAIRGVDSSGVLNTLLERALVTIRGRSKAIGRPLLYGTTGEFLSYFGLRDLSEMPRVEELKAIVGEKEPENPEAEPELFHLPPGAPPDPVDYALAGTEAAEEGEDDAGDADAAVLAEEGAEADVLPSDEARADEERREHAEGPDAPPRGE